MIQDSEDEERFLVARNGDNLVTPFQCDVCHFVNIMGREPLEGLASDVRLLKCIRRVNLDAFWAREPGTVNGVLVEAKRGIAIASALGFGQTLFWPRGPFPPTDTMGVGIAVIIVQRSLDKGRYSDNVQYETVRKFRAAASNIYHSSADGQGAMVMAKDTRKLQVTKCPTYSDFFEHFNRGLHKRMGDIVRPDRAIAHAILKELMAAVERDWIRASDAARLNLALEGAFYVLAFTLALRGEEIPLIELRGIHRNWNYGMQHAKPHVVITLLGRFKNEIGESYHLMPVLCVTPRGLEPGKWVQRVLEAYAQRNIRSGYMFRNADGTKLRIKTMEPKFHERLYKIKKARPDLIDPELEVLEEYGVSRSFRRGGTSEATNQSAPPQVVELNGRWRKSNQSGASRPNVTIREHYTDIRLMLDQLLDFSRFL
jgi:hypothetical protein